MVLTIEDPDRLDDLEDFMPEFVEQIKKYGMSKWREQEALANKWTNYFKSIDLGWPRDTSGQPVAPNFNYIVNNYFYNLVYEKTSEGYLVKTDCNRKIAGTNITIDSLARLINYGTLTETAFNYFDQVFDYFAENVQAYYEIWRGEDVSDAIRYGDSEEDSDMDEGSESDDSSS